LQKWSLDLSNLIGRGWTVLTDSSSPEFWNQRYAAARISWDFSSVPAALCDFLNREPAGRVLIPGCGTGYGARPFARAGWFVDAVDFSPVAVKHAQDYLGERESDLVGEADFFALNPNGPFDLIYERTFLCSLPLHLGTSYARQVNECLRFKGVPAGFFFFGPEPEPPPYPLGNNELASLLGASFTLAEDLPLTDSLPLFAGKERWQAWRK